MDNYDCDCLYATVEVCGEKKGFSEPCDCQCHNGVRVSKYAGMSPQDRYNHDAQFRTLVDMMFHHIIECNFTPTEMRQAALMASIKHAYMNAGRVFVDREAAEHLGALEGWLNGEGKQEQKARSRICPHDPA